MALTEQEDVLLQLLFNPILQARFCAIGVDALEVFQLSPQERADFASIRSDALQLDSYMRKQLILAQLAKQLPLTMTLFSSLADGLELLVAALDIEVMLSPIEMRSVVYAYQLQEKLLESVDYARLDPQPFQQILQCETAMCLASATLIQKHLQQAGSITAAANNDATTTVDEQANLSWAEGVSMAKLPASYQQLKQQLCPALGSALWKAIHQNPLLAAKRDDMLQKQQQQLLLSQAYLEHTSVCDPVVAFKTQELNAGFANIFKYIDGCHSSKALLEHLREAGADAEIINSVEQVFAQLINDGLLISSQ